MNEKIKTNIYNFCLKEKRNIIILNFNLHFRVPKVLFRVFDTLKNEIQKFMIRFCFYLNMKNKIQITDYYFHVKIDFYFEFLMFLFVFHFHKKWKTKYNSFFIFMKELKNKLLKQIVFTGMIYTLCKSKVMSSPPRFSVV